MSSSWLDRFPGLRALEPETAAALERGAQLVDLPAGQTVFTPVASSVTAPA